MKSLHIHLSKKSENNLGLPARLIWKVKALPWVSFFAWEAFKKCILTLQKLIRRCRILVNYWYLCYFRDFSSTSLQRYWVAALDLLFCFGFSPFLLLDALEDALSSRFVSFSSFVSINNLKNYIMQWCK